MAADIVKLPLTTVNEYVAGAIQNLPQFQLVSLADDGDIVLAAGPTEEVGGFYYRITGGDLTVTDSGVANGTVYILLLDDGDGTATAYVSTKSGDWDPNKGGYYVDDGTGDDGAKVIFKMTKSGGPIYSNKVRQFLDEVEQARTNGFTGDPVNDTLKARLDLDAENAFIYGLIF